MSTVSREHHFQFQIYQVPTLDELIAELTKARQIMGGVAKCRIKSYDDQRDGYSMSVQISGATGV